MSIARLTAWRQLEQRPAQHLNSGWSSWTACEKVREAAGDLRAAAPRSGTRGAVTSACGDTTRARSGPRSGPGRGRPWFASNRARPSSAGGPGARAARAWYRPERWRASSRSAPACLWACGPFDDQPLLPSGVGCWTCDTCHGCAAVKDPHSPKRHLLWPSRGFGSGVCGAASNRTFRFSFSVVADRGGVLNGTRRQDVVTLVLNLRASCSKPLSLQRLRGFARLSVDQ